MQRFLKRKVELHRSRGAAVAVPPGLMGKIEKRLRRLAGQSLRGAMAQPTADRLQKLLLIHGLIGTAIFQPGGAISGEQQQRLGGTVGFYGCRQQVGDSGARRRDYCHSTTTGGGQAQGEKGRRPVIDGRGQRQITSGCQQPGSSSQWTGAATWTQHQPRHALLTQTVQQRQGRLQIGAGSGQCRGSGWCDLGSMTPPSTTPPAQESSKGFWRNLIVWALLALLLRWVVVEPRWIPSGSMLPTLQLQDRILVEKIRPRLTRRLHRHLQRGDVVVFAPPPQLVAAGYDPNAALIKRVVGLPGDQLMVENGVLRRNGEEVKEPWISEAMDYAMAPIQVPEDQLWVMGDNRNASLDSHLWGPLPERNVIGTAIWRYWPLQQFGPLRIPAPADGS